MKCNSLLSFCCVIWCSAERKSIKQFTFSTIEENLFVLQMKFICKWNSQRCERRHCVRDMKRISLNARICCRTFATSLHFFLCVSSERSSTNRRRKKTKQNTRKKTDFYELENEWRFDCDRTKDDLIQFWCEWVVANRIIFGSKEIYEKNSREKRETKFGHSLKNIL